MKKCNSKCLKGSDSCCLYCDIPCDDSCPDTPDKCSKSVEASEQRKKKRTDAKLDKIHRTLVVGILLILGMSLVIVGLLNTHTYMITDVLNTMQI